MVYDNIGAAGLYIFSRAKPTLRQPLSDTRESSEKNSSHIPANRAVIPAKAGIQTYGFQKYSTMDVAWALPTNMVCRNIGCGGSLIYSRGRSPRYGSRLQIPASRLKKHTPHPCLLRRHSCAGGNPDLRLSEIFNDYCSVGFAHRCGLQKYWSRQGVYVLPAKPFIFSDDVFSQIKCSKIN